VVLSAPMQKQITLKYCPKLQKLPLIFSAPTLAAAFWQSQTASLRSGRPPRLPTFFYPLRPAAGSLPSIAVRLFSRRMSMIV